MLIRSLIVGLLLLTTSVAVRSGEPTIFGVVIGPSVQSRTMATVSSNGEVSISWSAAEQAAADPHDTAHMKFYAQLMLAIRDGTYKPLDK